MSKELTNAVMAVFDQAGVDCRIEYGGKHPYLSWVAADGTPRRTIIPFSESDWRSSKNAVADARRQLRDAGYFAGPIAEPQEALVSLRDGQAWCSSLKLAERFARQHKDVLRAIDKTREECGLEFDQRNFAPISYRDKQNREYRAYDLSRDAFTLVAMGLTGAEATAWKVRYIEAFNAMESEIARIAVASQAPTIDASLRADLEALTDIVLSLPEPRQPVRRGPFISPSFVFRRRMEQRRMRREVRAAQ